MTHKESNCFEVHYFNANSENLFRSNGANARGVGFATKSFIPKILSPLSALLTEFVREQAKLQDTDLAPKAENILRMRLTILIVAILLGGLRIAGTVAYWPLVVATSGTLGAIYFILSGTLLITGGSWLIWMLQQKRLPDIEYRMALAALLGGVWYWLERFWIRNLQSNLPFAITTTLFVEAVFWFPVWLKPYHLAKGKSHERESENSKVA